MRPPDPMMDYMTEEIAIALAGLSAAQVAAINAIVQSGHLIEEPLAPYRLIGSGGICAASTWARKAQIDPDTGEIRKRPGWSHQPAFVAALQLCKRAARKAAARSMLRQAEETGRIAVGAGPDIMRNIAGFATGDQAANPQDQISAARLVLPYAIAPAEEAKPDNTESDTDGDWWAAAEYSDDEAIEW